jgi:pimeloyl-ACP methyl ester carboxylesterase
VLVLSGAHDRTTPPESAQELVDAIPTAEHVVIDGAAHMIPYEQPQAFLAAVRTFLSRA